MIWLDTYSGQNTGESEPSGSTWPRGMYSPYYYPQFLVSQPALGTSSTRLGLLDISEHRLSDPLFQVEPELMTNVGGASSGYSYVDPANVTLSTNLINTDQSMVQSMANTDPTFLRNANAPTLLQSQINEGFDDASMPQWPDPQVLRINAEDSLKPFDMTNIYASGNAQTVDNSMNGMLNADQCANLPDASLSFMQSSNDYTASQIQQEVFNSFDQPLCIQPETASMNTLFPQATTFPVSIQSSYQGYQQLATGHVQTAPTSNTAITGGLWTTNNQGQLILPELLAGSSIGAMNFGKFHHILHHLE